jgi:lactate permease
MSVVFQTLAAIVDLPQEMLAPMAGLFLGIACILCGLAAAVILGQRRHIPKLILLGILMSGVQYGLAVTRLVPLSVMAAGLAGVLGGIVLSKLTPRQGQEEQEGGKENGMKLQPLLAGLGIYGLLTFLLAFLFLNQRFYDALKEIVWQMQFPATITSSGFEVAAAGGQAFRPLVHPGLYILAAALLGGFVLRRAGLHQVHDWQKAMGRTWRSAGNVSVGIISMVGLSTLMDHTGMTFLLARGLSEGLNLIFPLVSPLVGVLGAFATGSNNNSNVLFAPLQNSVAMLLNIDPRLLLAAQTTGGALGSMIAPAKILVGCSTVGLKDKDGDVLRVTIPYCIGICLILGVLAWVLA